MFSFSTVSLHCLLTFGNIEIFGSFRDGKPNVRAIWPKLLESNSEDAVDVGIEQNNKKTAKIASVVHRTSAIFDSRRAY